MIYNLGKVLLTPKGEYNGSTAYEILDVVSFNGSSYVAKQPTTGNAPTDGQTNQYWQLMASGVSGGVTSVSVDSNQYNPDANGVVTLPDYPTVPVQDVTVGGTSVVSNGTAVIPQEVFWATYNTTTSSEVSAALNSGKIVLAKYGAFIYFCVGISNNNAYFVSTNDYARKTQFLRISGSVWSVYNWTVQYTDDKKSVIAGNESSNTYYPTTKAVADYAQTIDNKVTSFQSTPDDTHYPSEKLVKDSLDTKIDNTDVEALTAIDVDNTPTANSSNLVTSGGVYNVLINKQDKMPISSASGTTLSAIANTYHNFTSEVNTLAITLPAVTDATHVTNIVFMMTTGTTPAITFAASGTGVNVIAQDGFSIEASTTYEINAIFNGTMWVVAAMKLSITPINS